MQINRRDRIHHETELCEFRRVQCHDCAELRKEVFKLGERQDELNKGQGKLAGKIDQLSKSQEKLEGKIDELSKGQAKLEGRIDQQSKSQAKLEGKIDEVSKSQEKLEEKIDQVTTRLQNFERNVMTNVNEQYLLNQRENAIVVQEIVEIKGFMNDVFLKLNSIGGVVYQKQEAKNEMLPDNQTDLQGSESKVNSPETATTKEVEHTSVRLKRNSWNHTPASNPNLIDEGASDNIRRNKLRRSGYEDDKTSETSHYHDRPGRRLSSDFILSRNYTGKTIHVVY